MQNNNLLYHTLEFDSLMKEFDKQLSILNSDMIISEEGLGSIAKKILLGVIDTIIKAQGVSGKNFISLFNVGGIFDNLLRTSPLKDYYNKNLSKVAIATRVNNPLYAKVILPKPRGMVTTYKEAYLLNSNILKTLNIVPLVKAINNDLEVILTLLNKKDTTVENFTAKIFDIFTIGTSNKAILVNLSKEHDKQFGGDETKETKLTLDKEFHNVKEFKSYCDDMVDLFKDVRNAKDIEKKHNEQALLVRKIVDQVSRRDDLITKENTEFLVEYFRYIASCYQLFGATVLTHLAMENNLIVTLANILELFMN